jgi:hypothetical protein
VTICIDTFFVNKMPFLHTISERIHYRTSQWIPDRETSTYQEYLAVVFKLYIKAGFNIKYVCADQEFDRVLSKMKDEFKFTPSIVAAQEHVPLVERSIRVVKERCRAVFHANPFESLPRVLMKAVVQECTKKLNFFPVKGGCSDVYSPRTILHEVNLQFDQCKVPQLSYVMAHDEPNPTNSTQQARAIDGIYMRALTTAQEGHEIFNVNTGEMIQRRNVTCILITDAIVKAIKAWARRDSMEAYKIENKHGIILYDTMIAGVELEDQEETEDPPEEEAEEEAQEVEKNEEAEAQPNQEIDRIQEENNKEEDDEEALQGAVDLTKEHLGHSLQKLEKYEL